MHAQTVLCSMCASCEAGYELSDDNRCICTRKPCKGRCPAGQVWAGFVGRQWLEHNVRARAGAAPAWRDMQGGARWRLMYKVFCVVMRIGVSVPRCSRPLPEWLS